MRRMHRILDSVGASQASATRFAPSGRVEAAAARRRGDHKNLRQQMVAAFTAPSINAAEVERLRKQSMANADKISAL